MSGTKTGGMSDYEQLVKDLTENLEPSIFEEEWEKGRLMGLDLSLIHI